MKMRRLLGAGAALVLAISSTVASAEGKAVTIGYVDGWSDSVATTNVAARNLYEHLGFTLEREFIGQFNGHSCPVSKLRYHKAA